ncbi:NAD(P)/FAD-dependent oxidoreductase [Sulfitobacter sp. TBRI5]|uniref:NAD(P)/FAD-dependent oxidoreductase n=1 Tax=Sulfitobacter sp. TBRI5 TaxID=2989732 RepID=UPI003D9B2CF4
MNNSETIVSFPSADGFQSIAVLGGGPAGLTAAYELQKQRPNADLVVLEASAMYGGIARTECHDGYRFDIGGHRFFTKLSEVEDMWHEVLGGDFITVERRSRIFYRGQFFDYPLKLFDALTKIGAYESFRILLSYIKWQVRPHETEDTFEEWVMNRFGGRLYMHFFKSYTEKVWGIPANTIRSDWAAQRIKSLTLAKAVWNALSGANDTASLIEEFQYPRLGPGMMWERTAEILAAGGARLDLNAPVNRIMRNGMRVTGVEIQKWLEEESIVSEMISADSFINSIALKDVVEMFDPPAPPEVLEAAHSLKYRDFMIVTLVLDNADPFPDNWIYVHSPDVRVGRIQNFRAWSADMLPNDDKASIGMEYFCYESDDLWQMADAELIEFAGRELERINLSKASSVVGGYVIRQPKAYPVYDEESKVALDIVAGWLRQLENFQCVGRNGQHRYNNQDHSMLSAMYAVRNLCGSEYDIWDVNVDRSYHEQMDVPKPVDKQNVAG